MKYKRIKILSFIAVSIMSFICGVILIEFIGQNFLFKGKLYYVNDIDHRMLPNSRPDLNSDGIRSQYESSYFREEDLNILFLGDSFIHGWEVPYNKTIPQLFEEKARALYPEKQINVANFGWISSSPLLSYRLLKDIGKKYNPDLVILSIDMTDFQDDIKYLRFMERNGIYRYVDVIPVTFVAIRKSISLVEAFDSIHESVFGFPAKKFFITEYPLEETKPWFSYIQTNIENINTFSKTELGAEFMLMILPRCYQYSDNEAQNSWENGYYEILGPYAHEPFIYFEEIQNNADYPIYSLLTDFQNTSAFPTCYDNDPHWNELGNNVAAQAILKYCLEEECFEENSINDSLSK